ncbi:sulfurtransferase [Pseudomonas sp. ABC1]|uniref:sulfurtransferase n=1 Tax=Pseudomonas sp. ABC1 TaxID=2748080 RepID=UPI0015C3BED1|nr:sulfurtransferase [Pseudomonas sp. ABC1]QLF94785.1 sulfurtransferase [Pseudomonas sp. ABC1]
MTLRKLFVAGALAIITTGPAWASDYLVDTDWVEKNIDNPKVRIIEVSVNPGVFERGHIPGAVNLNWHTDLVDTVNRDIASREQLQALLRKAGVSKDTTTILYGDSNNWFAAWGAWVFDVYQIDNVKLLDGGRKKWEDEKRPLASVAKTYKAGDVTLAEADKSLRAFLPDVVAAAKKEADVALIDIRGPDEYSGKLFAAPGFQELAIRAGHVPGAVNVPWGQAVAEDGTFKSKEELKKLYASKGVDGSKPIITYCRIGERSSHTWFALSKILGYDVRNYDGSWTEYGNSVGVPITNLAGTVWGNQ